MSDIPNKIWVDQRQNQHWWYYGPFNMKESSDRRLAGHCAPYYYIPDELIERLRAYHSIPTTGEQEDRGWVIERDLLAIIDREG